MSVPWWRVDLASHGAVDRETPIELPIMDPGERDCLARRHRLASTGPMLIAAVVVAVVVLVHLPEDVLPRSVRGQVIGYLIVGALVALAGLVFDAHATRPARSAVKDATSVAWLLYLVALVAGPLLVAAITSDSGSFTTPGLALIVILGAGALLLVRGGRLRARTAAERAAWHSARRWNELLFELGAARSAGWDVHLAAVANPLNERAVAIVTSSGEILSVHGDTDPGSWQRVCLALGLGS